MPWQLDAGDGAVVSEFADSVHKSAAHGGHATVACGFAEDESGASSSDDDSDADGADDSSGSADADPEPESASAEAAGRRHSVSVVAKKKTSLTSIWSISAGNLYTRIKGTVGWQVNVVVAPPPPPL